MKELIIKALEELQQEFNIEQPVMNRIQILSAQELANLEGVDTVEESFEIWGEYKLAVLYSDFPDYCFFNNENSSLSEIKSQLEKWEDWTSIIKELTK